MDGSRLWNSTVAAAFAAGLMAAAHVAGAQTPPGGERQPGSSSAAGDTRAAPAPDPKPAASSQPSPHPSDQRPLLRQPTDRSQRSAAPPRAGAAAEPRSSSDPGSTEKRPESPDASIAKSGVRP